MAYAVISGTGLLCDPGFLRLTSVAHVAIICAVVPFVTAGLAKATLKKRPQRDAIIASDIAFAGAEVMIGLGHGGTITGNIVALVMTPSMALMMAIARGHPEISTLPAGVTSATFSILLCLPVAQNLSPMICSCWPPFASCPPLGSARFLIGFTKILPVKTALPGALDAPQAPVCVWLVFADTPTSSTLIGGCHHTCGGVLAHRPTIPGAPRDNSRTVPYKPGKSNAKAPQ